MSTTQLLQPILEGGIRNINFFNGRLLSGEDLSQEQAANQEAHQRLGRALGEGIAYGLEVSATPGVDSITAPTVTVKPGLAVNRKGESIALAGEANILLLQAASNGTAATGDFSDCPELQQSVYLAGAGVYLLTMASVQSKEGRAPVSGVGAANVSCNIRFRTAGVQFRLLPLNLPSEELLDVNRLRNRVAYKCFGASDTRLQAFQRNPLGPALTRYNIIDDLRPNQLTDCDVPLAVLHWTTTSGIRFIDTWAARRRIASPVASERWSLYVGDRRASEAEAMFLQFQDHIEALRLNESNPAGLIASQWFKYLPPVGILPLASAADLRGFDTQRFFQQQALPSLAFIEAPRLEALIRAALPYPPIDTQSREMIRLYRLVEADSPPRFVIFTSGYALFQTEARFDLSRWSFSNFERG